nr:NAD-dependent epimerase/dehydratase family protein [uncultured Sellimonas sp.]
MKKILITGGTVFVSRYAAEYYVKKGYDVYVLNRNHHPQSDGVTLIEGDRHHLGSLLFDFHFDVILDITAYTGEDVKLLLNAVGSFDDYILISSSAVYPDTGRQPFTEETPTGKNQYWLKYGSDKIDAETELLKRVPNAYILRPPYLYGPMNDIYRESFIFDCALNGRPFYLPKDGSMNLQFFHVHDLCRFMDLLITQHPKNHIFNVGNKEPVSAKNWVTLCYETAGKHPEFINVYDKVSQRNYFSFCEYEYLLDVEKQYQLMPETIPMTEGLKESLDWYLQHPDLVEKTDYLQFIDMHFKL